MKKQIAIIFIFLLLVLSACSNKDENIRIGFIGTLTGLYSEVGINTMYGVQMAVDEINESGGVNGSLLELHIRDDEAIPEKAVQMQNELKDLGCNVIIGHSLSIVATEAVHNANNKDILLLSPSIGTDFLTGIDDNFIRLVSTVYFESRFISESMMTESPSKVMIITNKDNEVLTQYHLEAFLDFFTEEGYSQDSILQESFFSNKPEEIEKIEEAILTDQPDAIMIASSNNDAAPFINYIKGLDLDISIHLTSWAGTSIQGKIDSVDTSNVFLYNDFIAVSDSLEYLAYKTNYENLYNLSPDMLSTNGYDSVYILYTVLLEGTKYEATAMKNAIIEYGSFEGINDTLLIDEYGDNMRKIMKYEFVNGSLEVVE